MGQQVAQGLQQLLALVSGHGHVLSLNQQRLLRLWFQDVSKVWLAALLLKQFAEYRSLPQGSNEATRCVAAGSSLWFYSVLGYLASPCVSLEESS